MEKIFGNHSVRAVFLTRAQAVRRVILLEGKKSFLNEEYITLVRTRCARIQPEILPWDKFLRASELTADDKHQGVCIFAEPRTIYTENELKSLCDARLILALDQITNPQNLGTILRNAAFFGADAVILLKNRSTDITPTVTRVAVGGAEFVKIFKVINLARSLDTLKKIGFWVYGLDERGEKTLAQTDFAEKTVFVVGAEGEGLRLRTGKFCDVLVRIPGGRPGLESLNAGVATAVALAEFFRAGPG
ncbi:MAG: 23S rRNA (guanosine(2251)-2'-O)-methyltransferase RlmB [Candidatus Aminicenantes bacterium]|nr:23S rRNA (guanosine(2251)-2'-O)-methyltransferase RlmB [Candidatus Aminicenantes bacterium]